MRVDLFANAGTPLASGRPSDKKAARSGAFTDNMKLPIHRWFRYSAGFSAQWVESIINARSRDRMLDVLDPFCGSGTTLLAASACGANSVGFEAHPFVCRIARSKTQRDFVIEAFSARARDVLENARATEANAPRSSSELLRRCYSEQSLARLEALREVHEKSNLDDPVDDLIWLSITSILRECSGVGTAQWQYLLPNKSKARTADPFEAFQNKIAVIEADLAQSFAAETGSIAVLSTDARDPLCDRTFDLVVTSPPYPNNYDYADATRLEMTFWGEISAWSDLQSSVRKYLVRACSQHSAAERLVLDDVLDQVEIAPIKDKLASVCKELDQMRQVKAGKKTYHTMVAAYFLDLAKVWNQLRPLVRNGGEVAFVVGDSAPYGVHVPCEKWLAELAVSAGFSSPSFTKLRDRNIKWKNRKHQVPLHEGILWLKG